LSRHVFKDLLTSIKELMQDMWQRKLCRRWAKFQSDHAQRELYWCKI